MSRPVHLYRAVTTQPENFGTDASPFVRPAGVSLGRESGYLSRSSAVDAGARSGIAFEIVKSEPVRFLSRAEKLREQIAVMTAELALIE